MEEKSLYSFKKIYFWKQEQMQANALKTIQNFERK